MSDIQVQDPYTTRPKFYKYESEDRQLLVDLLHEYSEKLMSVASKLEIKNQQSSNRSKFAIFSIEILFGVFSAIGFFSVTFGFIFFGVFVYSRAQSLFSGNLDSTDLLISLPLLLVSLGIFLVSGKAAAADIENIPGRIDRNIYLLSRDARLIADKLEKVMRVTIEIQDKIEVNLARKLELDLRIVDAQSALEYYYSIVEKK
jgi:hypothetical protein